MKPCVKIHRGAKLDLKKIKNLIQSEILR
jgi:hypothetical protein